MNFTGLLLPCASCVIICTSAKWVQKLPTQNGNVSSVSTSSGVEHCAYPTMPSTALQGIWSNATCLGFWLVPFPFSIVLVNTMVKSHQPPMSHCCVDSRPGAYNKEHHHFCALREAPCLSLLLPCLFNNCVIVSVLVWLSFVLCFAGE